MSNMSMRLKGIVASVAIILGLAIVALAAHPKTVRVRVTEKGFSPSSITIEKGSRLTLIFTRTTGKGCGSKVVIPSLGITKDLPVGKKVTIKFTPTKEGEINFTCGMGMYKGSIVATDAH